MRSSRSAKLAAIAAERSIPVHTDAVQAVGRIPVDFHDLGVTTLAASAHKFHGPVGIGLLAGEKRSSAGLAALWRRPAARPATRNGGSPARCGSGRGSREVAQGSRDEGCSLDQSAASSWNRAWLPRSGPSGWFAMVPQRIRARLPQTLNLGFAGVDGDALFMQLDLAGIAVSLGSACASGSTRPRRRLMAMRVPDDRLRSSVRFSLGAATTENEIEQAITRIIEVARSLGRPQ